MSIFGRGSGGGLMNVIRCDQEDYLVWKWRPLDQDVNSTTRENSIRYGSRLRVKDGELAVFFYKQNDGSSFQDFILGPYDDVIKTANFPILANLVGMAFGGEAPFQAEIYFINLQGNNQIRFAVPYFDVFDPRFPDFPIPMAVHGILTFNITDYKGFIKLNRLINFNLDRFRDQIKDALTRYIKGVVTNIPMDKQIPVIQMERRVLEINDDVMGYVKPRLETDFGVNVKGLDISNLVIDKESEFYEQLYHLTATNTARTFDAQTNVNIRNLEEMQAINAENMAESMRIQREEAQRAQRLQTEQSFIGAHTINKQADVLDTAAQSLGQMGNMNLGSGGNGGFNPAGMMTGMMMGGAMGGQMAGMMNQMGQQVQGTMNTPPPVPNISFMLDQNGAQFGPFDMSQLAAMAQNGQLTPQTYAWKQGMTSWEPAGTLPELAPLFAPPVPPTPGSTPPPPTI